MDFFPQNGEIVVCRIYKILDYGVFVEFLEYSDLTGFVHISQVSSSWIKNIRNFVKENQVRAAQVVAVDREKKQVDLSFNKVSASAQREKIELWKQSKRAQKLLELIAEKNKLSLEKVQKEVAQPLLEEYETLFDAFQAIRMEKKEALNIVPAPWLKAVQEVVEKNIEVTKKEISGVLTVTSTDSAGVEHVKKALFEAQKAASLDARVNIFYIGSGKYMVKVSSFDFKAAEKTLRTAVDAATEFMRRAKGSVVFSKG